MLEYYNYVTLEMSFILFYEDLADGLLYELLWYAKYFHSKKMILKFNIPHLILNILKFGLENVAEFHCKYQSRRILNESNNFD